MPHTITVSDNGHVVTLDYEGMLDYHGGGAVAGATMGFRVMQAAAGELTEPKQPMERQNISIVSGHPGPGYRDAFEYVTRCETRQRFELNTDLPGGRLSPYQSYAFQFLITDTRAGKETTVTLRKDIIPIRFYEVLRDLRDTEHDKLLEDELETLKHDIARKALALPLDQLFQVSMCDVAPSQDTEPESNTTCLG